MFILVFRPHRRPAWAESFETEQDFVDAWTDGYYRTLCHAEPDGDEPLDYEHAFDSVGHDLSGLTRLDSADEVRRYLTESDYAGRHNKGLDAVSVAARELGWLE
jgi:hypothetical protein